VWFTFVDLADARLRRASFLPRFVRHKGGMMRLLIIALLMAIWCAPVHARSSAHDQTIWLEPLTYQQMREMMDKAKEMAAKAQMGKRPAVAGKPEGEAAAGKEEGKKRSWGDGQRLRRIYLRTGAFPAKKNMMGRSRRSGGKPKMESNASGSVAWLERSDNTIQGLEVKQRRSTYRAEYSANDGGWYRIYAYNDLGVRDKAWVNLFSYYTFMSHGDKPEKRSPQQVERAGYFDGHPELELLRVYADGKPNYGNYVGEQIRVRALFRGMPVATGRMVLATQQGWKQSQITDENGEALFTLIKEDFPADGVNRRNSELYLLRMEHKVGNSGKYRGVSYDSERYIATMPFRVSPAKDEWQIKYLAYIVAMVTIIGAAVAIAIRRRRRRQG
jgi:hypothetical protein